MSQTREEKEQLVENEEKSTVESSDETSLDETVENEETTTEETTEENVSQEQPDELALLKEKLAQEEERYIRLRADFDNLKRRNQIDRVAQEKYRAQNLLTDLLPVLDNFERALQVEATTEDAKSMKQGIEMVYRSLIEATKKEGLEPVATENAQFDPNIHHAVMQEKDDSKESGIVLQELQKGYMLKDRVLRPAMVKVNE
ncbi:nucleotide exchange factor GrpE [Rummeliibacillus sp. TYF005]|mgnify:CR=1 FL=1|uniref:nucleotide exchange factor GrpE n=1 Tax=Rummeliibacillus sp. TYF005 TaxID=2058214 RepID=UPI000F53C32A|nr:nucleotide exchange factor GrpE [Rummeliibacillus sp. TYF005]RPJ97117.1 nucleotide exchange factor GrpE [Rummeliibacillus sp. TYF005]